MHLDQLQQLRRQFSRPSDVLYTHKYMPADTAKVRAYYLAHRQHEPGPVICASPWIPKTMVEHLMRNKRDLAIGTKYISGSKITNMQGALHTFVTALVPVKLHGDYVFRNGHNIQRFHVTGGKQQYRSVIVSTMIHLDFEDENVGMMFFAVRPDTLPRNDQCLSMPQPPDVRLDYRNRYENMVRTEAYWQLIGHKHAALDSHELDITAASQMLSLSLTSSPKRPLLNTVRVNGKPLYIDMMLRTVRESLSNDLRGLEILCKAYIYTWDPPSIFARMLDANFLNLLMVHALRDLLHTLPLVNMKAFAFNDYADKTVLPHLQRIFANRPDIACIPKSALFDAKTGLYTGLSSAPHATLVLHNNSDGFGQNCEFEGLTSMDGIIGCYSSLAAGLHRQRPDLVSVML